MFGNEMLETCGIDGSRRKANRKKIQISGDWDPESSNITISFYRLRS